MFIVYFLRNQSFFIALGVGWRIFGRIYGSRGNGGGIICHQKSIKGDYRILTADEEGGGVTRILESLIGESGKFYHDIAQILQTPPPSCSLAIKKTV